jgi:methylmalonyl-CoA mutase N-terminal domain/subunit
MWYRIMAERFGAQDERSKLLRFHTQTGGSTLTAQQPANNVARVTLQALAAVLGGTQSLHTNSYDEALGLPTEQAAKIALRTQQVIAHETGVTNTIDPLGGSYFVEALTDRLEALAYDYFGRIDALGGMVEAVKQNFPQREIADASYELQTAIDAGERVVVGVNRFESHGDVEIPTLRIDPGLERKQLDRLQGVRARRDAGVVAATLAELRGGAVRSDVNLMPALLACARAHASEGEIIAALQDVWGGYLETPVY